MTDQLKGSGLGRGLSSLIPKKGISPHLSHVPRIEESDQDDHDQDDGGRIVALPPREIRANPYQPRRDWREDQEFKDLMESIKKHGILQPLVVTRNAQGEYELVAGERRLRASLQLRVSKVPCIIRSVGQLEKLELALIENIQRKDLNPIERAAAYRKLIDEFSLSHDEAAKRLGKSRPVVSNTLRYLQLPSEVQKALADGVLSEGQAKTILELKTEAEQFELYRRIVEEKLTVADARIVVARTRGKSVKPRGVSGGEEAGIAAELEQHLGTRVRVVKRGRGGEIRIEYYSSEEFASVVSKLLKS